MSDEVSDLRRKDRLYAQVTSKQRRHAAEQIAAQEDR